MEEHGAWEHLCLLGATMMKMPYTADRLFLLIEHVISFSIKQRKDKMGRLPDNLAKCSTATKLWFNHPEKYQATLEDIMHGKSPTAPSV